MVSCASGKRPCALSGAVSLALLAMKSFGSSGGGALVGAKEGAEALLLGMDPLAGRLDGSPEASLLPVRVCAGILLLRCVLVCSFSRERPIPRFPGAVTSGRHTGNLPGIFVVPSCTIASVMPSVSTHP